MNVRLGAKSVCIAALCLIGLAATRPAAADTITVAWDPNPDLVGGYAVYIGAQPGTYTQRYDVGGANSYSFSTATPGQQYCFAVAAYVTPSTEGPKSIEVCGFSNQVPSLNNPGSQSAVVGQSATLQLVGADPDAQPLTYSATGLPPGLTLMASTGFISGTGTTAGTYTVIASASDGVLSASRSFTWTMSASVADTTPPTISIAGPTTAATYSTASGTLVLSGTSADNKAVTQVDWVNDRGGSGIATGTTSWSAPSIALQSGSNVITVTARDAAGNQASDVLTVTYTPADGAAPSVTIAGPTSATTYVTSATTMALSGTAADNVGVTQVTWANNLGGSGTASGTTNWSVASILLQSGSNVITVTARDAAGNQSTDALTVTYTPADVGAPSVTIAGPTLATTYATSATTVALSGTAADNVGVTQVTWVNSMGGSGTASGTTNWSVGSVALQSGSNVITVTARDAAGNTATDVLTVSVSAPAAPLQLVGITANKPTPQPVGTAIVFTAAASGGTAPYQYQWTLYDGLTWNMVQIWTTSPNFTWTPTTAGSAYRMAVWIRSAGVTADAPQVEGSIPFTIATAPVGDATPPTATIAGPTTATSYATSVATVALSGTAADNVGVTQVSWANNMGGSGTASGTTNWSVGSIALQNGSNVITVTARDAAGNQSTDALTVTYTAPVADTTPPTVAITGPTTASTYTTTSSWLTLSGTGADAKGVTDVSWANNRGGSGIASGTTNWSTGSITLQAGSNVITITARDAAGNAATDVLTVTYDSLTTPGSVVLSGSTSTNGLRKYVTLKWTTAPWLKAYVFRNDSLLAGTANDGLYVDQFRYGTTYTYRVCPSKTGTTGCSNTITVQFPVGSGT